MTLHPGPFVPLDVASMNAINDALREARLACALVAQAVGPADAEMSADARAGAADLLGKAREQIAQAEAEISRVWDARSR